MKFRKILFFIQEIFYNFLLLKKHQNWFLLAQLINKIVELNLRLSLYLNFKFINYLFEIFIEIFPVFFFLHIHQITYHVWIIGKFLTEWWKFYCKSFLVQKKGRKSFSVFEKASWLVDGWLTLEVSVYVRVCVCCVKRMTVTSCCLLWAYDIYPPTKGSNEVKESKLM